MTHRSFSTPTSGLRVFSASLLSALLIMMPFVQMAAASRRSAVRDLRSERGSSSTAREDSKAATEKVFVDPALPGPVAVPLVPSITATMTDTLINDDGDTKADPTNGVPATTEKIRYTVTISNAGGATDATNVIYTNTIDSHTTLVAGSITTQPIAVNDSFNVLGNVRIQVPDGASDLMGNDCDPDPAGGPCTNAGLTASGPTTGPTNGQATVNADGSFSYNPNPGYTGADSFTYTVTDATGKTDTATVNLTISGMIWFVDDSVAGGGDGRLTSPFNCLTGAGCFNLVAADDAGDNIFLYAGTYNNTSVFALLDTQKLIGQGSSSGTTLAAIAGVTVPTHSDALPTLNNDPSTVLVTSTAAGIQLEQDNTLRGFTVGNTVGTGSNYDIQNTTTQTVGTLNISEVVLNGTGGLFRADSGGALSVTFNSAASSDAGGNGIQISNATGSFTVNGAGAISGVDGADVLISGGSATIAISSSISNTLGRAVDVQARSGNPIGGITFSGAITDTGGQGIFLDNNDLGGGIGAVTFSGGLTLNPAINNTAFTATNGGIVNVSGTNNITTTGTGQGINWNGDTSGSTVTFNNVTSATGAAVTIQNSSATDFTFNDITSGAASAVTLNTTTGDFIFHAINSNGAAKGISVTSATGTFTVNGTGTTDGSGGTVQNATSRGAEFISSNNILLKNMNFTNNGVGGSDLNCNDALGATTNSSFITSAACESNIHLVTVTTATLNNVNANDGDAHGIAGIAVNGLTLTDVNVERNGTEVGEDGVQLVNSTGTVTVSGASFFRDNAANQFEAQNGSGSAIFSITGAFFGLTNFPTTGAAEAPSPGATTANSGLLISASGTASMTPTITGSTFEENYANGYLSDTAGSATMNITVGTAVSGNTFTNNGVPIEIVNTATGSLTYIIRNNTITNDTVVTGAFATTAITGARSGAGSVMTGTIDDNTIGTAGVQDSGCFVSACDGISLPDSATASTNSYNITVTNNVINQVDGGITANIGGGDGSPKTSFVITGNIIGNPNTATQANALQINSGTLPTSTPQTCVEISGNTFNGAWSTLNGDSLRLRHRGAFPASTFRVRNWDGVGGTAGLATFLEANNTFSGHTDKTGFQLVGSNVFTGGAGACPLMLGEGGIEAILKQPALMNEIYDSMLRPATSVGSTSEATAASLTQGELDATVSAAIERWSATGLSARQEAILRSLTFQISDLEGAYLGEAGDGHLLIDRDASGKGWFVDSTPADDVEFAHRTSATRSYTNPFTSAAGRIDLLTALEHEIGHRLGLKDSYAAKDRDSIMYGYLTMGERRVPARGQAINARPGSLMGTHYLKLKEGEAEGSEQKAVSRKNHAATSRVITATMSGETVTIIIGTLRPGDSVTITYDVTVNNPPNLSLLNPPRVSNQGSVSYNDGATPQTPVLTDEVAGGLVTATETEVDLFDTTTSLGSNLNPSNDSDPVTFTATVTETPSQATADATGTVDFIDTSNGNAVICNDVAISGPAGGPYTAQCQVSNLSAGSTHNIRADYSGDGNFEASQSNIVAQVVNACVQNPVVTNTNDSGAGSLREALATVCSAPNNNITFNIPGADPGHVAGVYTITLLTELTINKNLNITGPNSVTNTDPIVVSGNNVTRVFHLNPNKTSTIRNLGIANGNANGAAASHPDNSGGGILNEGNLTLINSTVSGNVATSFGGGIYSWASSGTNTLNVLNSTFTGNQTTDGSSTGGGIMINGSTATLLNSTFSANTSVNGGGGVMVNSGTTTITNCTIVGNTATTAGGGVRADVSVSLRNTIVANSTAPDDISGPFDTTNGFNLIEDPGAVVIAANNITGQDPNLGPLAGNGGSTQTHALLTGSPALEAGSNANLPVDTFDLDGDANTAETLPVDQRGVGYPRVADSSDAANTTDTVDIGAYEAHPTVENIGDKTTAEDTAFNFDFNIGDDSASLITSVVATSSNQTLVPDANLVETDGTANDGVWNLQITPAANANSPADGTATITVTVTASNGRTAVDTFVVTVTEVNDAPAPTSDTVGDIGEDCSSGCTGAVYVIPFATLLGNDTNKGAANESGQTLNITAVSSPTGGTVVINGTDVEFTPTANFFGAAGFTYTVTDNGTTNAVSDPITGNTTVSFNITAVNDNPVVATNTGITVSEGSLGNTITSAMLSVTDVDNTASQIVFTIGTAPANGTLKKSGGALAGGGTFTQDDINNNLITYDHDGTNTTSDSFTFTVSDGAGGSIGLTTFNITITAANDPPVVTTTVANLSYAENDPATAVDSGVTITDSDNANLTGATVSITTNFQSGQDVLGWIDNNGADNITLSGSSTAQTIILTGSDTVANYQAAVRAVTYVNTSENPSTLTRTVTFTANDGTDTGSNTRNIDVASANDAPVNTVPVAQGTAVNTPLTFSSGNGNQISVADADAGANPIKVTLSVTNGTLTLNGTTGLDFSGTCSGAAGDGTADATMTFCGTLTDINNALNGMTYTPALNFSGGADLTITSNDQGNTGGGAQSDTDMVNIQVASNVSIHDAQVPEPASPNTVDMTFTVALNAPAGGAITVNFQTNDGTATAGVCGNPGADYVTTNGQVAFAVGEQVKTINVPVCSDNVADNGETFTVTLSSPSGTTIVDGTATGTITANTAGTLLISELRTSGPGGAGDDFVEIYNNTNAPITVTASDASAGYGLYKMGADCNATPVLIGVIPNNTVIPARGHYLFVGSAYSLTNYGGTGAAAGNLTLSSDIETDGNVGLFTTSDVTGISTVNRLDAVGFGANVGGACNLLREPGNLPAIAGNATLEHSYFRKMCDWQQGQGCTVPGVPKDTNNNLADFWLADTTASAATGRLGAPGPENMASPIRRDNAGVNVFLLDGTVGAGAAPNRSRIGADPDYPGSAFGTMTLRYRVTNNTGAPVTRLRYRVVDISTANQPPGPTADLRALTGFDEDGTVANDPQVGPVNDSVTCTTQAAATPCTVTVLKTTLETPPNQAIGGGYNSTLSSDTVTITPLPNGQSILINFKLGVQKTGTFRFYIIVEALP